MANRESDQAKMYRIFKLIELLSAPPYYTTRQLAERIGVTPRSVSRYFKLLEKLGFLLDEDERGRHYLFVETNPNSGFNTEEAGYLNDLLQNTPVNSEIHQRLLLKLNRQYRLTPLVQSMQFNSQYSKLRSLQRAVDLNRVVRLLNYTGGDGKVSNRRVAITGFTRRNRAVQGHDLDIYEGRQFVIERIGLVELTDEPVPEQLTYYPNDIFGWPGTEWFEIHLRLSERAYQLLLEEYPESRPHVQRQSANSYMAHLPIRGFEGAGRFCAGLAPEIEVLEGGAAATFRAYLNERMKKW